MAGTKTPFELLQEKLTKAVEENTKAQAKALEASTTEGKEIRRLQKSTAKEEKRTKFIERDLGQELREGLISPFSGLAKAIPKPLKALAAMPIQAMMRAQQRKSQLPQQLDASGTPMYPEGGKAFTEAMGREMSQKGYYKGAVAATAAKIPGMGMVSDKMMGSENKTIAKMGEWLGFSDTSSYEKEVLGNWKGALARLDKINIQLSGLGGGRAGGGPKKGTIMEHEGKTYRWEGKGRGGVGPQWSARSEGAGATGKFLTGGKEGSRLIAEAGGNKALTALFEEQLAEGAMFGMDPDFYGGGPTSQLKATQIHSPEAEYRSDWMEALPTANTWLEKIFHVLDTSSIARHSKSALEETIEKVFDHRRAEGYEHITGPTKESVAAQAGLTPEGFAQAWPEADIMQTTMSDQWGIFLKMATTEGSIYTHDAALTEAVMKVFEHRRAEGYEHITGPTKESVFSKVGLDEEGFAQAWPEADVMQTTKSDEWGIFLKMATTKGSIYTHDTTLNEKVQLILDKLGVSEKKGPARAKEDKRSEEAADKKEGRATSLWRGKLLGMFGGIGGGGGLMGWMGGKAKGVGKKALGGIGAGLSDLGKWIGGALGIGTAGSVAKSALAAKAASGATVAAGGGAGTTVAAAGGLGVGGTATMIVAPVVGAGMVGKDIYDLASSKEEWETKRAENVGGIGGGVGGMAAGAALGASLGAGFFGIGAIPGAIIGGGLGMILGNFVGETVGKTLDKSVDKKTRAQLTALGRRFDQIADEKEAINNSELSNLEKRKAIVALERESTEVDAKILEVKERQKKIRWKAVELADAERKQSLRDLEADFKGGRFGPKARAYEKELHANRKKMEKYRDGELDLSQQEQVTLETTIATQEKTLRALGDASISGSQTAKDAAEMKEAFLEADNTLTKVDIKGWGDESELNKILAKAEKKAALSDVEQRILDEYHAHQKKFAEAQEGEVDTLKGEIAELEGKKDRMDTGKIDWKSMYVEQNVPWKAAMDAKMASIGPEGQQVGFHQRPTNVVDIYAPKDSAHQFHGWETMAQDRQVTDAGMLEKITGIDTLSAAAAGAGITSGAAAVGAAVSDTTQAAVASDKPIWEQVGIGKTISESVDSKGYDFMEVYLDEEQAKLLQIHNLKMAEYIKEIGRLRMQQKDTSALEAKKDNEEKNWRGQLEVWDKDTKKQEEIKHELEHREYKRQMEKGKGKRGRRQTMDDETEDSIAQQRAKQRGEIHRQYYGKDKEFFGDDMGAGEGRVSSDAAIAGMLKDSKMAEGKIIPAADKTALENALIKEGIEIQKRIAKSKGWFSNVYEGSDKEGRKIDQARLDEIKAQVPYAKYHSGDEMDDPTLSAEDQAKAEDLKKRFVEADEKVQRRAKTLERRQEDVKERDKIDPEGNTYLTASAILESNNALRKTWAAQKERKNIISDLEKLGVKVDPYTMTVVEPDPGEESGDVEGMTASVAGAVSDTTTAAADTIESAPKTESSGPVPTSAAQLKDSMYHYVKNVLTWKPKSKGKTMARRVVGAGGFKNMLGGTHKYAGGWHNWFYEKYGVYPTLVSKVPKGAAKIEDLKHPGAEAGDKQLTLKGGFDSGPSFKSMRVGAGAALRQAQAKTAVLNQGAQAASAAGKGGDTIVTVSAPTTANQSTTVQNLDSHTMTSSNPRGTRNLARW